MNNLTKDILILILVFVVLEATLVLVFFMYLSEGGKCVQNPLVYGVRKISQENDYPFVCSCPLKQGSILMITQDNITVQSYIGNNIPDNDTTIIDKLNELIK